ncbi:hypothetical protein JG688_00008085 [Phytophthora aleatoria]|uniref:Uncharacterized protein n=1 Tax=Phytophthora aleatoria TaxID=2496075 RepID=A0A8J5J7C4_9STRA|nr:hypothetical protein JG688_00008085 [Phytophthora aleatoria]
MADEQEGDEMQETNVKALVLAKVVDLCEHHKDAPMDEIQKPLKCNVLSESGDEWPALPRVGASVISGSEVTGHSVATEEEVGVSESEETGHGVADSVSGREVTGQGVAISVSGRVATGQGAVGSVLRVDVIRHGAHASVSVEEVIEHGVVVRLVSGREVTGHGMIV